MKYLIATSLSVLALLFVVVNVSAHNGWVEINTPIVEKGQKAYTELYFGNHSDQHTSYRIDRKWGIQDTKVIVKTPSEKEHDMTSDFYYMGEVSEVDDDRAGLNNFYNGSFKTDEDGIYTVTAKGDFKYGDQEEARVRTAKAFVAASETPTIEGVEEMTGYEQPVTSDRAEIVPMFNPVVTTPGEFITAQLILNGEPVEDEDVSVIRRSDSADIQLETDLNGKFGWEAGEADYYLIRAELEDEGVEYEATMTFVVQEKND
ncbi:DUF4198 domain-containing protein [Alkalibacillus silvisoli]|uniref:DUF4198 domain-containing protein n=1 Tax=Alkalibacillus silvisoli TaxID=392823 RepID=A0ABP3JUP4_9BACI